MSNSKMDYKTPCCVCVCLAKAVYTFVWFLFQQSFSIISLPLTSICLAFSFARVYIYFQWYFAKHEPICWVVRSADSIESCISQRCEIMFFFLLFCSTAWFSLALRNISSWFFFIGTLSHARAYTRILWQSPRTSIHLMYSENCSFHLSCASGSFFVLFYQDCCCGKVARALRHTNKPCKIWQASKMSEWDNAVATL